MNAFKALVVLAGSYGNSLFLTVISLFITIGITTGMGAGRTGTILMAMLCTLAALFFLCTIAVFLLLGRNVRSVAVRVPATAGYGVVSILTLLVIAFLSMVLFNR